MKDNKLIKNYYTDDHSITPLEEIYYYKHYSELYPDYDPRQDYEDYKDYNYEDFNEQYDDSNPEEELKELKRVWENLIISDEIYSLCQEEEHKELIEEYLHELKLRYR